MNYRKISVIGLGYVGLPVAVAFGKKHPVIGFDINPKRIEELRRGADHTGEVTAEDLRAADIRFTFSPEDLRAADFHIVAVPTPVDDAKQPDLGPTMRASESVGRILKKGDIVVYESTFYPGSTEDDCIPVLEKFSGLKAGRDFTVGYSPERINPGDKTRSFTKITKVVSGQDAATLEIVANVYGTVVEAGVFRAASIKVAESAKVIENIQRDVNIALMNELALIFQRLGIDTQDVLDAAATKWNFIRYTPGLVGGHCIGVDPYYMTHKAARLGYHPQVILAGRRINDDMGHHVSSQVVKGLIRGGSPVKNAVITVLGITFKENVPDIRNSRVIDIIRDLAEYGAEVQVFDPLADASAVREEYGIELCSRERMRKADGVVLAVPHREFSAGWPLISGLLKDGRGLVFDVKSLLPRGACPEGVRLLRL